MNQILKDISMRILQDNNDVKLIIVYGSYAFGQMKKRLKKRGAAID